MTLEERILSLRNQLAGTSALVTSTTHDGMTVRLDRRAALAELERLERKLAQRKGRSGYKSFDLRNAL